MFNTAHFTTDVIGTVCVNDHLDNTQVDWCISCCYLEKQKLPQFTSKSLKKSRESARLKIISSIHKPSETALDESCNKIRTQQAAQLRRGFTNANNKKKN